MRTGPGKHLKGLTLMGGIVKPEEVRLENVFSLPALTLYCHQFDYFHEVGSPQKTTASFSRLRNLYSLSFIKRSHAAVPEVMETVIPCTSTSQLFNLSSTVGLQAGSIIGLPPVQNFGSPEIKARVVPEVLSGKKFICLAISEAFAGSDVVGLKTTARKTEDGKHWIITGTKKWITNGQYVSSLHHCWSLFF
jgi:hypothetical protein